MLHARRTKIMLQFVVALLSSWRLVMPTQQQQ
jgi:hypothetical protein